ncbi:immunity 22 family protein [Bacillus sp. FSL W7-1360]
MEKNGFVSLWLGKVEKSEEMDGLLQPSYTSDGDFVPSVFARSFKIERYEPAVQESDYLGELRKVPSR